MNSIHAAVWCRAQWTWRVAYALVDMHRYRRAAVMRKRPERAFAGLRSAMIVIFLGAAAISPAHSASIDPCCGCSSMNGDVEPGAVSKYGRPVEFGRGARGKGATWACEGTDIGKMERMMFGFTYGAEFNGNPTMPASPGVAMSLRESVTRMPGATHWLDTVSTGSPMTLRPEKWTRFRVTPMAGDPSIDEINHPMNFAQS